MEQNFLMIAKFMPEEKIIDDLSEAIQNYKILQNPETKNKVFMEIMLLAAKWGTEKKDLVEVLKDFDKRKRSFEMFQENKS